MQGKIITQLSGGLGNQMFMYAAARAMALRMGASLYLDCSGGFLNDRLYRRNFALNYFNTDFHIAPSLLSFNYFGGNFIHRLSRHLRRHLPYLFIRYLQENRQQDSRQLLSLPFSDYYLEGYWQSEAYFSDYKEQIRKDFRIVKSLPETVRQEAEIIKDLGNRCIALCVRRYQEVKKFVNLSVIDKTYYLRAMDEMAKRIKQPVFLCFSQVPEWVKENLSGKYEIRYISPKNDRGGEIDDLFLLTQCSRFILSNSTFYWWGAWLSNAVDKQVIAPDKWFIPETPLKEWTIIHS